MLTLHCFYLGLDGHGSTKRHASGKVTVWGENIVIGPSGGLMSKGHPIGATGIAQCVELTWHLTNRAGDRQVDNARLALAHNIGLGGAAVVTVLGSC